MTIKINPKLIPKVLIISCLIFLIIDLTFIVCTPEAQSYEISIYNAFPNIFWINLISLFFFSSSLFIFGNHININKYFKFLGLLLILSYYFIIICIPMFRGYPFADPQDLNVHLAHLNELVINGNIGNLNIYPGIHILFEVIELFTNLNQYMAGTIITILFIFVFISGISILSEKVTNSQSVSSLCLVLASIPIFGYGYYFHPSIDSILLIPTILFVYFNIIWSKRNTNQYSLVLMVLIFSEIFYHPVTLIYIILIIMSLTCFRFIQVNYNLRKKGKNNHLVNFNSFKPIIPIIALTIFATFILNFNYIRQTIKIIYQYVFNDIGTSFYEVQTELLSRSELTLQQSLYYYVNIYGPISILAFILFIFFIVILYDMKIRKEVLQNNGIKYFFQLCLITTLMSIILFFIQSVAANVLRILSIPLIFTIILDSIFISMVFERLRNRKKAQHFFNILLSIIILLLVILTTYNYYPSPTNAKQNIQITNAELQGVNWSMEHIGNNFCTKYTYIPLYNLQKRNILLSEWDQKAKFYRDNYIPSHFGYDKYQYISDALNNEELFIVFGKRDFLFKYKLPKSVWNKLNRIYEYEDLNKLLNDHTINKIYSGGESYYVWKTSA
ncbi:hypothetical protein [Methanogenium organophilum]|uniref:Uncharacterized protein n=1 Tax=Methanogenium organophilum TaxID=2199 RepID=A0A9X9S2Z0_METOG|nr:hypothetical protein [Methanogenium organophilum]WAI00843.1 hypothetical protein OU421_10530 [Methanogenium organophilum]